MGIKTKLPGTLQLPADLNKDIWSFYELLTCSTTIDDNKILAVVSVPLLDSFGKLEIFKAHILPSVMSKTTLDSKNDLVAQYALEAPALAIDASRVKYNLNYSVAQIQSWDSVQSEVLNIELTCQNFVLWQFLCKTNVIFANTVKFVYVLIQFCPWLIMLPMVNGLFRPKNG